MHQNWCFLKFRISATFMSNCINIMNYFNFDTIECMWHRCSCTYHRLDCNLQDVRCWKWLRWSKLRQTIRTTTSFPWHRIRPQVRPPCPSWAVWMIQGARRCSRQPRTLRCRRLPSATTTLWSPVHWKDIAERMVNLWTIYTSTEVKEYDILREIGVDNVSLPEFPEWKGPKLRPPLPG